MKSICLKKENHLVFKIYDLGYSEEIELLIPIFTHEECPQYAVRISKLTPIRVYTHQTLVQSIITLKECLAETQDKEIINSLHEVLVFTFFKYLVETICDKAIAEKLLFEEEVENNILTLFNHEFGDFYGEHQQLRGLIFRSRLKDVFDTFNTSEIIESDWGSVFLHTDIDLDELFDKCMQGREEDDIFIHKCNFLRNILTQQS